MVGAAGEVIVLVNGQHSVMCLQLHGVCGGVLVIEMSELDDRRISIFVQISMMKFPTRLEKLLLAFAFGTGLAFPVLAKEPRVLSVNATGFVNTRGSAVAKLFEAGENVRGHSRQEQVAHIKDGKANFQFTNLPLGRYALVVFHDENSNNEIDHGMLKMPTEALGFSGGYATGLFSGLPSFDKLAFSYDKPVQQINIVVK
jgi:uncharacterized protein (DUF2141 family)